MTRPNTRLMIPLVMMMLTLAATGCGRGSGARNGLAMAPEQAVATADSAAEPGPAMSPDLDWRHWSPQVFLEAAAKRRFVLLYVDAGPCAPCQAMAQHTFVDPQVVRKIREHFIAVHVDVLKQPPAETPDHPVAVPATLIFDGQGQPLLLHQGFLTASEMNQLLSLVLELVEPEEQQDDASPKTPPGLLIAWAG